MHLSIKTSTRTYHKMVTKTAQTTPRFANKASEFVRHVVLDRALVHHRAANALCHFHLRLLREVAFLATLVHRLEAAHPTVPADGAIAIDVY